MNLQWDIYINGTLVEEPQGFSEIVLNIQRDEQWHGIFFEASTSVLRFYGDGADLLRAEKQTNGLSASATFRAEAVCGETVDVLNGNFDFGTYNDKCGNECMVEIAIEKEGCLMTLKNRFDQKVDLQKTTASDNTTLLQDYRGLNFNLELTAQQLQIGNEAEMEPGASITDVVSNNINWADSDGFNNYIGWISPPFPVVTNESFGEFNATPIIDLAGPLEGVPNRPPYPNFPTATGTATLLGDITCELVDVVLEFRLKGNGSVVFSGGAAVGLTTKVFKLPAGLDGTVAANWVEEYAVSLFSRVGTGNDDFDTGVLQVPLTVVQGDFIYFGLSTRGDSLNNIDNFTLRFDAESYFKLTASSQCENSNADVSFINETGDRIVESITDACLSFKSDYYGRTDSQPWVSDEDGCGGLRVLSNGLKIRNADPDNHFISLDEFFRGLNAIDNIGMGIEDNTVTNLGQWLRMEPVEYFYQNVKLLELSYIPEADNKLEPQMGYSIVKIGYEKWEVERVNGLNEFNSNKEFRTSLKTINNTLEQMSNFVAGGIPIEITRQQSFAVSGAADTKYDNDTFIICVERNIEPQTRLTYFGVSTPGQFFFPMAGGYFLAVGSVVAISGTALNDGNYTILSIIDDGYYYYFTTVEPTVIENGVNATFTQVSGYFGNIEVEKGNVYSPANIFSPATVYNWRIRPMYNLMRWFKSIAQSYVNLFNTTSKLFFSSGTGNYIAEGILNFYGTDPCALENQVIAENDDLSKDQFNGSDWVPIFQPETISFTYPLSIADYVLLKANPYGYIDVQCGNGSFEKAFIKSISYKPVTGEASFILVKKWQN